MHLIFGLPRRPTVVLMHDFRNIVRLSLKGTGCPDDVWGQIPIDTTTLAKRYNLDPVTHPYVCCPECFALYPLHRSPAGCTYLEFENEPAYNANLSRSRMIGSKQHTIATRLYLHQNMKEWVGRLLSRPDIDKLLDKLPSPQTTNFIMDLC